MRVDHLKYENNGLCRSWPSDVFAQLFLNFPPTDIDTLQKEPLSLIFFYILAHSISFAHSAIQKTDEWARLLPVIARLAK